MKEKTLVAHMCEQKRRALQRDEKRVQAGFMAYNRFYKLTQNQSKPKSYAEFCESSYYNAFVKFGSFVNNINPLYPDRFIDHVIKSGVKLDHWCRDELYDQYLQDIIKVEPVESAIQRTLTTMMEWADNNQAAYNHYFIYVNTNRLTHDLRNGSISPWMILNVRGGQKILNSLNDDQLSIIGNMLDIPYWLKKFKTNPADLALIKEIIKEAGIE